MQMADENKAKLRRFFDEVLQKGNMEVIDELVATDFVDHNPGPVQAAGVEGVKQFFAALRAAMSNLQVDLEHVLAEGDLVATHVSIRGKHTGDLMGIAPTGRDVVLRISDIVRMVNGKAVERWGVEDMSGLFSQHS
jgi:predicted ester cyclase